MTSELGSLVISFRRSRAWSQKRLALESGLDQSYLAGVERGRRPPPRDAVVKRLANALKLSAEESHTFLGALAAARAARVVERFDPDVGRAVALLTNGIQYCSGDELQALATLIGGYQRRASAQKTGGQK